MTVTKLIYTCYYTAIQRQRDSGHYSQYMCPQPGGRGRWLLPNTLHSCIVNPPLAPFTNTGARCAHTCMHTCTAIASFFSHPAKKKKKRSRSSTHPSTSSSHIRGARSCTMGTMSCWLWGLCDQVQLWKGVKKWPWLELGDQCCVGMEVEAGCSSSPG